MPRMGAIIRTRFSPEVLANSSELACRTTQLKNLIRVLSSVKSIGGIAMALPDLPAERGLDLKTFRPARVFHGDEKDVARTSIVN